MGFKVSLISFWLLFSLSSQAAVDFSGLQLTEENLQLLSRLEARGFDEDQLQHAAEVFDRHNRRPERQEYIPPHTWDDLWAVLNWGKGESFATYAARAGFHFDHERYMADCPNLELFNFGHATGNQFLRMDVLIGRSNTTTALAFMAREHRGDPAAFSEAFLSYAEEQGFAGYLSPLH